MRTELIAEARKRAVSAAFGAGPNTAGPIISPDLELALALAKELESVTALLDVSVPARFAQHLASAHGATTLRCEMSVANTRCQGPTVAVRWEDNFADSVCDLHAQSAMERGAVVAYPHRHDGVPTVGSGVEPSRADG